MRRDLNQHVRLGQVEASIRHFTDEYRVHFRVELEVLQDLYPFALRRGPVDVGLVHFDGVMT